MGWGEMSREHAGWRTKEGDRAGQAGDRRRAGQPPGLRPPAALSNAGWRHRGATLQSNGEDRMTHGKPAAPRPAPANHSGTEEPAPEILRPGEAGLHGEPPTPGTVSKAGLSALSAN